VAGDGFAESRYNRHPEAIGKMGQVLFLCTANYYRSRFAEHYFNWLASRAGLDWQAHSRGLDLSRWDGRHPISRYTLMALTGLGVPIAKDQRNPKRLTLANLVRSDLIFAVKRAEHRQMVADRFPFWTDLIEYWNVDDVDCARPEEALPVLGTHVRKLVVQLANQRMRVAA
jgi:protein-tyrosine phosphatase